jgi:hypothetical protein
VVIITQHHLVDCCKADTSASRYPQSRRFGHARNVLVIMIDNGILQTSHVRARRSLGDIVQPNISTQSAYRSTPISNPFLFFSSSFLHAPRATGLQAPRVVDRVGHQSTAAGVAASRRQGTAMTCIRNGAAHVRRSRLRPLHMAWSSVRRLPKSRHRLCPGGVSPEAGTGASPETGAAKDVEERDERTRM